MFLLSFPCFHYTFYVSTILSRFLLYFLSFYYPFYLSPLHYPFYLSIIFSIFLLYFLYIYYIFYLSTITPIIFLLFFYISTILLKCHFSTILLKCHFSTILLKKSCFYYPFKNFIILLSFLLAHSKSFFFIIVISITSKCSYQIV